MPNKQKSLHKILRMYRRKKELIKWLLSLVLLALRVIEKFLDLF